MNPMTRTLTQSAPEKSGGAAALTPTLVLALDCDRPSNGAARLVLDGITRVTLGRASEREIGRTAEDRSVRFGIPDGHASSLHACLVLEQGRWLVEDLCSKNGTFVNGERHLRRLLDDGDIIEIGHTLFVYLEQRAAPPCVLPDVEGLATLSLELAARFSVLPAIARSGLPVLVLGPTGSGKELAARAIHALSGRSGPFVAVNAAALPSTLLEGELFGYRKGSFSGAEHNHVGLIRSAEGGTLFLDEIGELPLAAQAALLRVLQEKEVVPLGTAATLAVDVRIVAATNRDLEAQTTAGAFREDLLARLSGFRLDLPALEDRRADVGPLISSLLQRLDAKSIRFSVDAGRSLLRYGWPRNVRELFQALAAAVACARDGVVELSHLPRDVRESSASSSPVPAPLEWTPKEEERRLELVALLHAHHGNVTRVAGALGKARVQIQRWVRRFDLNLAEFRR